MSLQRIHSDGRRAHDTFSSAVNIDREFVRERLEFEGKRAIPARVHYAPVNGALAVFGHRLLDLLQDVVVIPQLIEHILDGRSIGLRPLPADRQLNFPGH